MVVFTNTDKALMMRAARLLAEQGSGLKATYGFNWAATPEARKAKLEYDRLLRDERDLRALSKRIEAGVAAYHAGQAALVPNHV